MAASMPADHGLARADATAERPLATATGQDRRRRPSVGLTGVWLDPADHGPGHGVFASIATSLERLGLYGGYREAFPAVSLRLVRPALRLAGRPADLGSIMLSRPMQALSEAEWSFRRLTTPRTVDAWITSAVRSVRGRYATITDQSPRQILGSDPETPSVVLQPGASRRSIRYLERRAQITQHRAYVSCAASHWAASSLVDHAKVPAERVKVVGFGVGQGHDADQVPRHLRDWSRPCFLFVGGDWRRKNGDAVIRAFRAVRAVHPDATLHLVGGHPRLCEEGVSGHGSLFRHDPGQRRLLDTLFARATSLVLPSVVEPFGHVHVEAGSVGVGSIGTTVGGAVDAIGPGGGILVDPHDDGAILEAMLRFCDPAFSMDAGRKALAHSRLLSWDLVTRRILRALDIPTPGRQPAEFL